ncbi:hypothetical protein M2480_002787, partial [Parabacteroides sp. PFB2-12]|nr:hypothetical protein [Parabacteroides sp. PFB2-12]
PFEDQQPEATGYRAEQSTIACLYRLLRLNI